MGSRASAPVVGKALEAAIVVLYLGLVTTTLYGGAIPDYRTAAGDEVGERALAAASADVRAAVPANATRGEARYRVDLPPTIRGEAYRVRVEDGALVLDHPHPSVDARVPLSLPADVGTIEGEWHSGDPAVVAVDRTGDGTALRLERGED